MASIILVVGGTPMTPGFIPRLHAEIARVLSPPPLRNHNPQDNESTDSDHHLTIDAHPYGSSCPISLSSITPILLKKKERPGVGTEEVECGQGTRFYTGMYGMGWGLISWARNFS